MILWELLTDLGRIHTVHGYSKMAKNINPEKVEFYTETSQTMTTARQFIFDAKKQFKFIALLD